ncbi:MAG: hypothetical protein ACRDHX_01465, partial [Chloroflexota bacterium]
PGAAPDDLVNRSAWTAALRGDREAGQAARALCWRVIADTASDRGLAQRARFLARAYERPAPAAWPTDARWGVPALTPPSSASSVDRPWQEGLACPEQAQRRWPDRRAPGPRSWRTWPGS